MWVCGVGCGCEWGYVCGCVGLGVDVNGGMYVGVGLGVDGGMYVGVWGWVWM